MSNHPPPVQRLRLTYSKKADARYIGHLDEARFWERVFRRATLPLAYSHSFHPQPRMQFAAALPVGVAGENELLDVWLSQRVEPDEAAQRIARNLPPGFRLKALFEAPLSWPAMQASLRAASYRVCWQTLSGPELMARAQALLAQTEILRRHFKKPNKSYDLRPRIHHIELDAQDAHCLLFTLQAGPQGNARISEVIAAMDLNDFPHHVVRQQLFIENPEPV